ncbi:type II toxin-antitoxin system VapC family toxin [Mucilaginibacter mali]|uniref:Ribonuclease VapC n=1 Tax=Mucilaginibacter mali TaxID=2740462 RepID=A0A7D4UBV4_9SPHI|nr:type II toxin-antitoxin system VapC family toxin [Mucilaginibacter mali]QKJ31218.1 type II toxin-antitoxin system VapC family toxin [Mucilaginibacter mali]
MVIDTSIFIEHLRAKNKSSTTFYQLSDNSDLFISAVSVYELYLGANTPVKRSEIDTLLKNLTILSFTEDIAVKAAEIFLQLKAENKLIEFRDIFIAATCLVERLPIATLNKKHFQRIKTLKVV